MKLPITHDDSSINRQYKLCQCQNCGLTAKCAPFRDFYSESSGGPLVCEMCVLINGVFDKMREREDKP